VEGPKIHLQTGVCREWRKRKRRSKGGKEGGKRRKKRREGMNKTNKRTTKINKYLLAHISFRDW
jgi:hypothetical protein